MIFWFLINLNFILPVFGFDDMITFNDRPNLLSWEEEEIS